MAAVYKGKLAKQLAACQTDDDYREVQKEFPEVSERSLATLKRRARELRQDPRNEESLFQFLLRGRTRAEIEAEFGEVELPKQEGFDLYVQHNDHMEEVFVYLPKPGKRWTPKKPVFDRYVPKSGRGLVIVQFPDSFPHKRIDVLPLSDLHLGSRACNEAKVKEYIEYIRKTPNTFTFLNGDLIEYAGKGSPGSAIFEQDVQPRDQVTQVIELLRPIQHKILFSLPGNHEERSMRFDGIDVAQVIALALEVPYFRGPVRFDINWSGYTWRFHAWHGTSNSMTEGGKLNAAARQVAHQGDFVHCYFMGHVHDTTVKERQKVRTNYQQDGGPDLVTAKYYIVILPAFMDYFDSYGEWKGWAPSATGSVRVSLRNDGSYHART